MPEVAVPNEGRIFAARAGAGRAPLEAALARGGRGVEASDAACAAKGRCLARTAAGRRRKSFGVGAGHALLMDTVA